MGTVPWWSGGDTEWHHASGLRGILISMHVLLGHVSPPGVTHPPRRRDLEELLHLLLRLSRVLAIVLRIQHQLCTIKETLQADSLGD